MATAEQNVHASTPAPEGDDEVVIDVQQLTVKEILAAVPAGTFSTATSRSKNRLLEEVLMLPGYLLQSVQDAAIQKVAEKQEKAKERAERKLEAQREKRKGKRRLEEESDPYLESATTEERKERQRRFLDATSDKALHQSVCFSCAREMWDKEGCNILMEMVPNIHRLRPTTPHPAHELVNELLILPTSIQGEDEEAKGFICDQCLSALKHDKKPQLSLANGMWIGDIPKVLSTLTIPEQLLIAIYYPRCYIFKLYPRSGHAADPSHLQSGIRGNVTTFENNIQDVTYMLEGKLLPRPMEHLASVIAVAFVGKGKLQQRWLKQTFRVRRKQVVEALRWLKQNNRHYASIEIDAERVEALPEDDVPAEILSSIRHDASPNLAEREREGYVPSESDNEDGGSEREHEDIEMSSTGSDDGMNTCPAGRDSEDQGDVIPLQHLGCSETDLSNVSTSELMMYALANLENDSEGEGGYASRHSRQPVSDFGFPLKGKEEAQSDRKNPMEASFPCLYLYGQGGMEQEREEDVSFGAHIRWSLQYYDRRFRKHHSFPFVAFGIQQKRRALATARIQMQRKDFTNAAHLWSTITIDDLKKAAKEEEKKIPISDFRVKSLFRHLRTAAGRVIGSDQARKTYRSQIWATIIQKNPPNLWVTINPSDTHNPIAQVLAGQDISLDNFDRLIGPDADQRARNIAEDPYASALFFNFIINTILIELLGIDASNGVKVKTEKGVMGRLSAYFGVVEAQGRGTLHLHALLWLEGAPTGDEMRKLLLGEEFRQKVQQYIDSNIKAHLDGFDENGIKAMKRESDAGYSRPPHPDNPEYEQLTNEYERKLVRSQQVHTCKKNLCLKLNSRGEWSCKRGAPFETSEETTVSETGQWTIKRTYAYLNNWLPDVIKAVGCNCDGKFLTNGSDTQNITFYIVSYGSKSQQKSHNMSALLAQHLSYHMADKKYRENLDKRNQLLLFRCLNIQNQGAEYSGPQVISYLMGWNDVFRSHGYVPVSWSPVVGELLRAFPDLTQQPLEQQPLQELPQVDTADQNGEDEQGDEESEQDGDEDKQREPGEQLAGVVADESSEETIEITLGAGKKFVRSSQAIDYQYRGSTLEDHSFLDMMQNTYERPIPKDDRKLPQEEAEDEEPEPARRTRGRPPNPRIPYQKGHPKHGVAQRILRTAGHNSLVYFVGKYFPRRDDPDTRDFYWASMLALLKPWRKIQDLKEPTQSWDEAFQQFTANAPKHVHDTLSNIQYYYDCASAADKSRTSDSNNEGCERESKRKKFNLDTDDIDLEDAEEDLSLFVLTEADVEQALEAQGNPNEEHHGRTAVELGQLAKFFQPELDTWHVNKPTIRSATGDDLLKLQRWQEKINAQHAPGMEQTEPDTGDVICLGEDQGEAEVQYIVPDEVACQEALAPLDVSELLDDQRRAYEIVEWHLNATLAGSNPPQLLMQIQGEGGTGKSKVIQTITQLFEQKGVPEMLAKGAYTGIAASLIDGSTLHKLAMMRVGSKPESEISLDVLRQLQEKWKSKKDLIVDEVSMVARDQLSYLSERVSKAKGDEAENGKPFGGLDVILTGDFHQFPPVMGKTNAPLYFPNQPGKDTVEELAGRRIYEEFTTVVLLKKQVRVTDDRWTKFLRNLRHGACTEDDMEVLKSLVVDENTDLSGDEWKDAVLVTPRHAVRRHWNKASLKRHCQDSAQQLFICPAEDTIRGKPLTLKERWMMESQLAERGQRRRKPFPRQVWLAVGMRTMVTWNVHTELDVANGARGTVVEIVLDTREEGNFEEPMVRLKYPPAYVLVKLDRTKASKLEGLDEGVVPIAPMKRPVTFQNDGSRRTVQRSQLPITVAYAFTDYRSQGQTLTRVIVDIAKPPSNKLTPFHVYVALSRSRGRDNIRLLRGFQEELFTQHPSEFLRKEDARLERLNEATKLWWEEVKKRESERTAKC